MAAPDLSLSHFDQQWARSAVQQPHGKHPRAPPVHFRSRVAERDHERLLDPIGEIGSGYAKIAKAAHTPLTVGKS